jgi:hypothetical protein
LGPERPKKKHGFSKCHLPKNYILQGYEWLRMKIDGMRRRMRGTARDASLRQRAPWKTLWPKLPPLPYYQYGNEHADKTNDDPTWLQQRPPGLTL